MTSERPGLFVDLASELLRRGTGSASLASSTRTRVSATKVFYLDTSVPEPGTDILNQGL
jgi:hypothetical protein